MKEVKKSSALESDRVDIQLVNAGKRLTEDEVRRLFRRVTERKAADGGYPVPPEDVKLTEQLVTRVRRILESVDSLNAILRGDVKYRIDEEPTKGESK